MRIEKIRKLVWLANVLLGVGLAWYAFTLFSDSDPRYRYVKDLGETSDRDTESPQVEVAKQKSWYELLLTLPKDGERPAPEVDLGPTEVEEKIEKGAVAQLADLIGYSWVFIPTEDGPPQTTDESQAHLKLKKQGGREVWIPIGEVIPGSAWRFVDLIVDESAKKAKAIFTPIEGEDAGNPHELDFVVSKTATSLPTTMHSTSGGGVGPDGNGGDVGTGGSPEEFTVDDIPVFPEGTTRFAVTPRERRLLSREDFQKEEIGNISSVSWKNPDTGKYEGIQIKKVARRTYAYKRGVRDGDIVISINGKPVTGRAGVIKYLKSDEGKDQKQYVVVMRTATGAQKQLVYNVDE